MESDNTHIIENAFNILDCTPVPRAVVGEVAVLIQVDVDFSGLSDGFVDREISDAARPVSDAKRAVPGLAFVERLFGDGRRFLVDKFDARGDVTHLTLDQMIHVQGIWRDVEVDGEALGRSRRVSASETAG